ncbi:LysR substrate-binding domain-containing protein [Isoalcanivorax indicus]|uniref:LysR substrate-binding domain-containing protein n=1 Tax=Isoalcanivorax indicus TaxID=2202653 RepID=UPI000DBA8174|nr:LysR substrate-binding domain-containing protein [Isoalcanivorax indicus]
MFRSLPMQTMLAFESYARNRKLKDAAEELGVSSGNIRHHINNLEDWLGTPVFRRNGRSVDLTEAGQQFFHTVHSALLDIHQCASQLRPSPEASSLRLEVPAAFAAFWLVPRLGSFYRRHPDITLHIGTEGSAVDLNRDAHVDVAVMPGTGHSGPVLQHSTLTEVLGVFGTPDRVARAQHGQIELVALRAPLSSASANHWETWCDKAGLAWCGSADCAWRVYDHETLVLQAALAGQGLVLASTLLVGDAVKQGRLEPFRPEVTIPGPGYAVLSAPGRDRHPPVRAFLDWIARTDRPQPSEDHGAYTLFSL